jgi:pyruvate-formate lyase
MTKGEKVEVVGTLTAYYDNSKARDEGESKPDNLVITDDKGKKVYVANWANKEGEVAQIELPAKGTLISVPAVKSIKGNYTNYDYDTTRKISVVGTASSTTATSVQAAPKAHANLDDRDEKEEKDFKKQRRIGGQWAVNAAIALLASSEMQKEYGLQITEGKLKAVGPDEEFDIELIANRLDDMAERVAARRPVATQ